jgi:hypothetical protein
MGVSSFLKNLFGTAKETANTLTHKAEESLEHAKHNIKPFLEKLEDYTEDAIDKTKTTATPYFKKVESLVEETYIKAKQSEEPFIEKTKICAIEGFETIQENTAPIIINIENLASQTKDKMNEYADKAEGLMNKNKNNYDTKAKAHLTIINTATDIEISKLESEDLIIDINKDIDDSLATNTVDSAQKISEFAVHSTSTIITDAEEIQNEKVKMNVSAKVKKISKKALGPPDDVEKKEH